MKKVIVAILLVLPFLLIYFISFTGQVLSKYTHIAVERITVLDEVGNEHEEDDIIKIGLNDTLDLKIKVYPELASNKEVKVVNSNPEFCEYDEETSVVTGIEYGITTFYITSVEKPQIGFQIKVQVAHDKLEDFDIYAYGKPLEFTQSGEMIISTQTIKLTVGKSVALSAKIVPQTTLPIYRTLLWMSGDRTVAQVNANGKVTAIAEGSTTIEVKSQKINEDDLEIVKYVKITVVSESEFCGVGFDYDKSVYGDIYKVTDAQLDANGYFDLTSITKIGDDAAADGVTQADIKYTINSGSLAYVDVSKINEGKIKFTEANKIATISVYIVGETEPRDSIAIKYTP